MNITELVVGLDSTLALLEDAGIDFTVVCSGTESSCPDWQVARAA